VVIASSDSDFAPLVHRLREKGCVVRGIGQQGKTGDETQEVYDDFTVLEHRKAAEAEKPVRKAAARKAATKTAAKTAAKKAPAAKKAATKAAPARKAAARKTVAPAAAPPPPAPAPEPVPTAEHRAARGSRAGASVQAVLDCLPELDRGQSLALNVAVQRLREAQLLGKNSSSLKLFSQLGETFELLPADKPSQVRLRR
jgi:Tfp pilus assembly protein FimV